LERNVVRAPIVVHDQTVLVGELHKKIARLNLFAVRVEWDLLFGIDQQSIARGTRQMLWLSFESTVAIQIQVRVVVVVDRVRRGGHGEIETKRAIVAYLQVQTRINRVASEAIVIETVHDEKVSLREDQNSPENV
jgi:hypothetical protein